jgi:hypothetical protein
MLDGIVKNPLSGAMMRFYDFIMLKIIPKSDHPCFSGKVPFK